MPSLQQLRRRLKSISSIHQITKAMEMIATSKMQKATQKCLLARDYSLSSKEILAHLQEQKHPLLAKKEIKNSYLIFATSDRGLCGGFNSSLFRELTNFLHNAQSENKTILIITIGKKGSNFVKKFHPDKLLADFSDIKDEISYEEITPIAHLVIGDFLSGKCDAVNILYSHFESSFSQKPTILTLLPVSYETEGKPQEKLSDFLFEPSEKELLDLLIPQFVEMQIYQTLLESKASEYSARMLAMKNATENAKDLMDELYLTYHSIRQATITAEICDLTVAKQTMEQ